MHYGLSNTHFEGTLAMDCIIFKPSVNIIAALPESYSIYEMTTEGGLWCVKMDWSDLSLSSIDASAQVSVALHAGPTGIKGDRSPPLMVPHPFSGSCPGFEIRIFSE